MSKENKTSDKHEQGNELYPVLSVVFIVTDSSNYYQEPVTIRIFTTKEKAISFCDQKDPNRIFLDWEEFEVE